MDNVVVNELNSLLKGEHMAIGAYERYLNDLKAVDIRDEFQKIQQDHKMHASEIAGHIRKLGGNPDGNTGMGGFMASAKMTFQEAMGISDFQILKQAYDGEDKGIAMVEEIIKGDLDEESEKMVKKMMSTDHDHLKTMMSLIEKYQESDPGSIH